MLYKKQAGFSLVELMVALVLGLIVVGTVIEIFINSRQMYRVQDAKARLQENGRYALQFLTQHILNATYHGCASKGNPDINNLLPSAKKSEYQWQFEQPIFGVNDATAPTGSTINDRLRGDILTLRTINGSPLKINSINATALILNSNHNLSANNLVMASNCFNASVFQINTVSGTDITFKNATASDITPYSPGTLTPVSTKSFFIRENAEGIASLYWKNSDNYDNYNANLATEVIDGIEDMQLLYGIDTNSDGNVNKYVNANSGEIVSNWSNVFSVRVQLLLKSLDDNLTLSSPQKYYFDANSDGVDEEITATDNHYYKVITQTIALRNRVN